MTDHERTRWNNRIISLREQGRVLRVMFEMQHPRDSKGRFVRRDWPRA